MKKLFFLLILFIGISFQMLAQTVDPKTIYYQAHGEQLDMLQGKIPINFKRAVFLTENAYDKGQLNYAEFCDELNFACDFIIR